MTELRGGWRCAGASVIGTQHERHGGRCEDAWSYFRCPNPPPGVLGVCVADGAGSVCRGWAGAEETSGLVARWLAENFEEACAASDGLIRSSVASAVKRHLQCLADEAGLQLADFACTLVAVGVCDDGRWLALHLGDGGIAALDGAEVRVVSVPRKGEFANETYFVTDADAEANIVVARSGSGPPSQAFALFTDGVEVSLVDRHSGRMAPALREMFGWLRRNTPDQVSEAIRRNLAEVFRSRSGDDCTLVLTVAPGEGQDGQFPAPSIDVEPTPDNSDAPPNPRRNALPDRAAGEPAGDDRPPTPPAT